MKTLLCAVLLLAAAAAAGAWAPDPCSDGGVEEGPALPAVAPGEGLPELPHPFPRTREEVLADVRAQSGGGLSRAVLDAAVLEVENWTPSRCAPGGRQARFFLVRLFSGAGGELARAELDLAGFLAHLTHRFDPSVAAEREGFGSERLAILDLPEGERIVAEAVGHPVGEPQYVTTWGTLRCHLLSPCIAVRGEGEAYLLQEGTVFRLERGLLDRSFRRDLPEGTSWEYGAEMTRRGYRLVSTGADEFAAAVPVPPEREER